jgi:hypothetical protein
MSIEVTLLFEVIHVRRRVIPILLALLPVIVSQSAAAQGQSWGGYSNQQQMSQGAQGQQFGQPYQLQNQSQMNGQMIGQMGGQMSGQMSGQMNNQMGLQMNGMQQGFMPNDGQSQSLPMLNSAVSTQQFSPYVPGSSGAPGVDILDESLKYHNIGVAQNQNFNQNQNNAQTGNPNAGLMARPLFGGSGIMQGNSMQNGCQHGSCQHATGGGGAGGGGALGNGISTQAIGAVGAAALLGTFLTNGGVGGMIKSVGWDNSRHMRGASIGGGY